MFPLYFFLAAIAGATIHIFIYHTPIIQTVLLYQLVITVGLMGIYAFLGHFFKSEEVAKGIGWPTGNPFQTEVAFSNLAFGVMGILCIWIRGNFWIAVVIGISIFLWGAAYVHIKDIRKYENFNIYNAGPILYADLLFPLVWISLILLYFLS